MKFFLIFACVLAVVAANENANVIHNEAEVNVDNFKYLVELDNSVKAQQEGSLKGEDNWVVHGGYEWVSPEGEHVKVNYVADENGFQPEPNPLLPTPPPIPEYILKAIAYIEAHPSKDAH